MRDSEIRSRRVVTVISGLMFGGGQRVVEDLRSELCGFRPFLILLGCNDRCTRMKPDCVVPYDGRYNHPITLIGVARKLRAVLLRERFEVVHTHGVDADLIAWLACIGTTIRRVVHLHITADFIYSGSIKQRVRQWLTRRVLQSAHGRVTVSAAVLRHWSKALKLSESDFTVLHNGVDQSRYLPGSLPRSDEGNRFVVGVAARLAPMKGLEYALEAVALAKARGSEVILRVAGEGSLIEMLKDRARILGISGRVDFLGYVDDMVGFYQKLDIFLLPSVSTEGLPLGILEAMSCGLPVIATSVAGAPEAVLHGETGFLVAPRDAQGIAEAICRLESNAALRVAMGKSGLQRAVSEFSLQKFCKGATHIYEAVAIEH